MYNRQQNKWCPQVNLPTWKLLSILTVANLLAHDNLWSYYYGQVNSPVLKSSVALKRAKKHFGGTIYFAGDGTPHYYYFFFFFWGGGGEFIHKKFKH